MVKKPESKPAPATVVAPAAPAEKAKVMPRSFLTREFLRSLDGDPTSDDDFLKGGGLQAAYEYVNDKLKSDTKLRKKLNRARDILHREVMGLLNELPVTITTAEKRDQVQEDMRKLVVQAHDQVRYDMGRRFGQGMMRQLERIWEEANRLFNLPKAADLNGKPQDHDADTAGALGSTVKDAGTGDGETTPKNGDGDGDATLLNGDGNPGVNEKGPPPPSPEEMLVTIDTPVQTAILEPIKRKANDAFEQFLLTLRTVLPDILNEVTENTLVQITSLSKLLFKELDSGIRQESITLGEFQRILRTLLPSEGLREKIGKLDAAVAHSYLTNVCNCLLLVVDNELLVLKNGVGVERKAIDLPPPSPYDLDTVQLVVLPEKLPGGGDALPFTFHEEVFIQKETLSWSAKEAQSNAKMEDLRKRLCRQVHGGIQYRTTTDTLKPYVDELIEARRKGIPVKPVAPPPAASGAKPPPPPVADIGLGDGVVVLTGKTVVQDAPAAAPADVEWKKALQFLALPHIEDLVNAKKECRLDGPDPGIIVGKLKAVMRNGVDFSPEEYDYIRLLVQVTAEAMIIELLSTDFFKEVTTMEELEEILQDYAFPSGAMWHHSDLRSLLKQYKAKKTFSRRDHITVRMARWQFTRAAVIDAQEPPATPPGKGGKVESTTAASTKADPPAAAAKVQPPPASTQEIQLDPETVAQEEALMDRMFAERQSRGGSFNQDFMNEVCAAVNLNVHRGAHIRKVRHARAFHARWPQYVAAKAAEAKNAPANLPDAPDLTDKTLTVNPPARDEKEPVDMLDVLRGGNVLVLAAGDSATTLDQLGLTIAAPIDAAGRIQVSINDTIPTTTTPPATLETAADAAIWKNVLDYVRGEIGEYLEEETILDRRHAIDAFVEYIGPNYLKREATTDDRERIEILLLLVAEERTLRSTLRHSKFFSIRKKVTNDDLVEEVVIDHIGATVYFTHTREEWARYKFELSKGLKKVDPHSRNILDADTLRKLVRPIVLGARTFGMQDNILAEYVDQRLEGLELRRQRRLLQEGRPSRLVFDELFNDTEASPPPDAAGSPPAPAPLPPPHTNLPPPPTLPSPPMMGGGTTMTVLTFGDVDTGAAVAGAGDVLRTDLPTKASAAAPPPVAPPPPRPPEPDAAKPSPLPPDTPPPGPPISNESIGGNEAMQQVLKRLALTLKELVVAVPTQDHMNEIVAKLHEYKDVWSALRGNLKKGTKLKEDRVKITGMITAVKRDSATMDISSMDSVNTFKELQAYGTLLDEYIEHAIQFRTLHASVHTMMLRLVEMNGNVEALDRFRQGDLATLLEGIPLSQLLVPPLEEEPVLDVDADVSLDIHRYAQEVRTLETAMDEEVMKIVEMGSSKDELRNGIAEAIGLMKARREQERQRLAEQAQLLAEQLKRLQDQEM